MVMQRQAKVLIKPSTFYHRKVGKAGGTRTIAVAKMIPDDWLIVKCRVLKLEGKVCLLEITKLD